MSTAETERRRKMVPPLVDGEHLDQPTFPARYEAMPPETRAELVDGVVYLPSPMRRDHGRESRFVSGWLDRYERFTPGIEGADNATVKLDPRDEPQPDHFLRIEPECGGHMGVDEDDYYIGAPELVAEIAKSTRYHDLVRKEADCERAGVQESVVVEPDPDRIHCFVRRGDRFEEPGPGRDGIHRSKVFPGLWLDPAAVFVRDRSRRDEVLEQGVQSPAHAIFVARLARARRKKTRR